MIDFLISWIAMASMLCVSGFGVARYFKLVMDSDVDDIDAKRMNGLGAGLGVIGFGLAIVLCGVLIVCLLFGIK